MSGRKRPPRGAAKLPPTRNTDATNRGEGEEADYAHFEALWHRKLAASHGRRDDGPKRKRRRRAPPKAGREDDTKKKGGCNEGAGAGASSKGRNLRSPRDRWSQPLYHHLSIAQIDDLVGWATSHRGNIRETRGSGSEDDEEGRRLGLAHLPVAPPPPPSHIAFLRHRIRERREENPPGARKGKRKRNKTTTGGRGNNALESMSTSAHVAMGMAVEEALTMALMPLAEAHAARCRRLERGKRTTGNRKEGQPSTRRRDDDPFHAWTLPPAEAIAALAREGSAEGRTALTSLLERHPDVVAKHASPTVAKVEVAPKMEEDSSDDSGSNSSEGGDSESEEEDREELASKEDASSDGHDSDSQDEDKTPAADSSDGDGEGNDSDSSESGSEGEKSAAGEEDASSDNGDGSGGSEKDSEDESENAQRY